MNMELPIVRDIANKTGFVRLNDDLALMIIEGMPPSLPEFFRSDLYSMNLHVRGRIVANINRQKYTVDSPAFSSILINQPINVIEASDDFVQYMLGYSPQFAEDLHLSLSGDAHIRAYLRPVFPMSKKQMQTALNYFDLLRDVIKMQEIANKREVALHLVRSLVHFVYGLYDKSFSELYTLSRSEEVAGRFLALVDKHCHEHHNIEWYSNELCLSPKYIANLVRKVIGRSAGECITYNLIRQAKWLLLSTTLSVQEISDRLGFKNQSHFGTFFLRHTGLRPQAFRLGNGRSV